METIGKILSITLLTIFGSAAGAIYLVDNDILSSIFENTPAVYTSDSKTDMDDETFYHAPPEENRERREYASLKPSKPVEEALPEGPHKSAIWGQTYGSVETGQGSSSAYRLAGGNTADSLRRNSEYWKNRYDEARNAGRTSEAKEAYRKYVEYEEALRIKLDSGR